VSEGKTVTRELKAVLAIGTSPTIARVSLGDLALGCVYTLLPIASLAFPNSFIGGAVCHWMQSMDGGVEALLFFLPDPKLAAPANMVDKVVAYRNTLVCCLIISTTCIVRSRRHWGAWSLDLSRQMSGKGPPLTALPDDALAAYRKALIGMVATLFLLLLGEPRDDAAIQFLYGNVWTFLRAPLLLTLCCFFTYHAAAFRPWLPSRTSE